MANPDAAADHDGKRTAGQAARVGPSRPRKPLAPAPDEDRPKVRSTAIRAADDPEPARSDDDGLRAPMPHVLLLTAESLPARGPGHPTAGRRADRARASDPRCVPWTAGQLARTEADLAVIRTTWDYTFRRDEFLRSLDPSRCRWPIRAAVVRWNSHKGYLAELGAAAYRVVPTVLVRRRANRPCVPRSRRGPDHRQAGDLGRCPRGRPVRVRRPGGGRPPGGAADGR